MIREEKLYDHTSTTANSTQIELLKKHFPNCFDKNGAFMPHKMAEVVGKNEISLSRESYSLNWLGKAYARVLAHETPLTLLKADEAHNQKEVHKNSENILIKGDNLEVLKHLRNAYAEQIKMIYIDPPYNTGGDGFVYNDDRKFTPEQLMRLAGIELDEAKRILEFTRSKANSHSAWLTFMYPRLYIARELLREDGVIFISIDDNEQAQLKLLCDEVFGEENFVAEFIWKNGRTSSSIYTNEHEYILCYSKSQDKLEFIPYDGKESLITDRCIKQISIKNPLSTINFKKGIKFESEDKIFDNKFGGKEIVTIVDGIFECKDGKLANDVSIQAGWTMKDMIESWIDGEPVIDLKGQKIVEFFFKSNGVLQYVKEKGTLHPKTIIEAITTKQGSKELMDIIGSNIFSYPKPIKLIQFLMLLMKKDDLILDFFTGSGTTAHAVMDLNAKDGGKRKYICVQLPELTDTKSEAHKAGYNTIFDITKARIEKAAEKIRTETSLLTQELDLGFKIFETEPLFEGYGEEVETLAQDTTLFDGSTLDDESLQTLLYTWKLYDGLSLTTPTQRVMLAEYTAYQAGKNLYIMHQGFDINAIKALISNLDDEATFNASKIVLFGYNVLSTTQRELHEALQNYTNKKSIELDVVVRY